MRRRNSVDNWKTLAHSKGHLQITKELGEASC